MNKQTLALLEKAFAADINAALGGSLRLIQTRSKLAEQLVRDGLLERRKVRIADGPFTCTVHGYGLTLLGNFTYCMTCEDEPPVPTGAS